MLTIAGGRCNIFLIYNGEKERKGNYTGSGEVWISKKKALFMGKYKILLDFVPGF